MQTAPVPLDTEAEILKEALNQLRSRLPRGWQLDQHATRTARFRPDAIVALKAPQGAGAVLVIEVKRSLVTRELQPVVDQLREYASSGAPSELQKAAPAIPMVVARYLSPPLQRWLADRDVPYADATGNVRVALDQPALFLRDVGADKDPWRGPGRPKGNLTGEPPARVVRALADFRPPYSVPRVLDLSGASSGATYRVISFLEDQSLVVRSARGPIDDVSWRPLLERWSEDYGFSRTNKVRNYLAPRGLPDLTEQLAKLAGTDDLEYALTGTLAAKKWAAYAPARNAMIYTSNPDAFADRLGLREVDAGANVLLAKSAYAVVFERTDTLDGVTIVAPTQAAVDLMTGPGRNPAEAEALLDWMENNEDEWRR